MKKFLMSAAAIVATGWLVTGCSTGGQMVKPESISEKTWVLTSMDGMPLTDASRVTMEVKPVSADQGRISGQGPCNRYFGGYKLDSNGVSFTPMGSTMMACPEPKMKEEKDFLAGFEKANQMVMKEGQLVLKNAEGTSMQTYAMETQKVTGRVESSSGGFPAGSQVTVRIQAADAKDPRSAIGVQTIKLKEAVLGSVPFTVNYAPELVKKGNTYNVDVQVMNKGKVIYTSTMKNIVNVHHPLDIQVKKSTS